MARGVCAFAWLLARARVVGEPGPFNSWGEPLLEGQSRHRSMQILHHLSLHIAHICGTYCLALLPFSCHILPPLLSSLSFTLCLSRPRSLSLQFAIFNPPTFLPRSLLNENIPVDPLDEKVREREDHQSISGPAIIFHSCHCWNEYGFMAREM